MGYTIFRHTHMATHGKASNTTGDHGDLRMNNGDLTMKNGMIDNQKFGDGELKRTNSYS